MKLGLFASWVLILAAETVIPSVSYLKTLSELGALAILMVVTYFLFQELRAQRKENKTLMSLLCERWDSWEKIRHDDANKLVAALRTIANQCAATHALIIQSTPKQ